MFTIYILFSEKDNKRYIGFTSNIERRLKEHNLGKVKSTQNRRPVKLIYTEEFIYKQEAETRERFFKSHQGRDYLNSIGK